MLKLVTTLIHAWGSGTLQALSWATALPVPAPGPRRTVPPAKNLHKAPSRCLQGLADKKRANSCVPGKEPGGVWILGLGAHAPASHLGAWPWLR